MDTDRAELLRTRAHAFCKTLLSPPPPPQLLAQYFTPQNPEITEHGPSWATTKLPFLGQTFTGVDGCVSYFSLLSETLKMQLSGDSFPGPEGFIVDAEANMVSVVGGGRFESVRTGKSWTERFAYRLSGWDEDGKIGHWEIWADPLSAWVAVQEEA
ncbi:hypothetical protein K490DRAFT_73207 [Saccharata proteae CBS 121410]|uniref:SnoaL-like domain-containing protein n=1 Tax=Saccharata proteae CBS 121410 TaxID=1314787 RepID=A0A9P4HUF6_9PEZI|nr:hypothetical protein K490DRAFT_73207 [Saccharata proteae CBS 121410]